MKIKILCDNKPTFLEVPDEDCTVMIDMDYKDRLSTIEDKDSVSLRSVQEIMDERFNRPEYNNWHKFDRHRGQPKKWIGKDGEPQEEGDVMDLFPDNSDEKNRTLSEEDEYIRDMIRKTLKLKHAQLLIAIYLDDITVTEYAKYKGVTVSAISHQLNTAKNNFKKVFPKSSTFPSFHG